MKLSLLTILSAIVAGATAFAPIASVQSSSSGVVALNAEPPSIVAQQSRKAFISSAVLSVVVGAATVANAMDQERIFDPTERWETGTPTKKAEDLRISRYKNARTQLNSNFPPIKRLTLERKSPVTRLDLNAPDFGAYKRTYPGLFKEARVSKK